METIHRNEVVAEIESTLISKLTIIKRSLVNKKNLSENQNSSKLLAKKLAKKLSTPK